MKSVVPGEKKMTEYQCGSERQQEEERGRPGVMFRLVGCFLTCLERYNWTGSQMERRYDLGQDTE